MATNLAEERNKNAFLAPNMLNNASPFGVFETVEIVRGRSFDFDTH